ncbi:hypothetical protein ACO2Q0_18305 [Phenylobacterium sp. VNQ135]|uniref:hypothetical protein n=1 Tax=Phenylobacterium sp. VNQ135 TaxID=3400922 RepID=UPI003C1092AF
MRTTKSLRGARDLRALQSTGATSRVLNLALVAARHSGDPDYVDRPFFRSRTLNTCILVKHRVRADEQFVFDYAPATATKIILPFAHSDLALGARSMFVGQRGWREMVRDICEDTPDLTRDLKLLSVLDRLPSLDPFLLREQIKRHGFTVGRCYFGLSPADSDRMQAFVSDEISKLIDLAFAGREGGGDVARMVEILLSSEVDERLEPLRVTLGLEGEAYREGVFSWKGFLYYKWALADLWPNLDAVLHELRTLKVIGEREDPDLTRYVEQARKRLEIAILQHRKDVVETLRVYDRAFGDLTENGKPAAFREFLVKAPDMFAMLGERIGSISHVASFWRYRFPSRGQPASVAALAEILQDFEASLAVDADLLRLRAAG